jgi:hypothetical protein
MMKNRLCSIAVICLLFFALGFVAPVPAQGPPPPPFGGPVPGGSPGPAAALPDQGQTETFTYERSTDYPNTYVVYPINDEKVTQPFVISESMFRIHMQNPNLGDVNRLRFMNDYPKMVTSMYESTMARNFPDSSATYEKPFEEQVLVGANPDGVNALVKQDPSLQAYVQIILKDENGEIHELTLARATADQILANTRLSNDDKINALRTHPFHLTPEAKERFNSLSKEELYALLEETSPGVKKQEFVWMRTIIKKEEAKRLAMADAGDTRTLISDPSRTGAPDARVTPLPPATPLPGVDGQSPPPAATPSDAPVLDEKSGMSWPFVVAVIVGLVCAAVLLFQFSRSRKKP